MAANGMTVRRMRFAYPDSLKAWWNPARPHPIIPAMQEIISRTFAASISAKERFVVEHAQTLEKVANLIASQISQGHKLLLFGNGGSAADAQHIAAEFVNRFMVERRPLPALALTTDSSALTSIGNDYGFDLIFSKQVGRWLGPTCSSMPIETTRSNLPSASR